MDCYTPSFVAVMTSVYAGRDGQWRLPSTNERRSFDASGVIPVRGCKGQRGTLVLDGEWLEPQWTSGYDLAAGADLLIHDAQFTDQEYACCVGWGHSTYRHAFEFAKCVGAKQVILFHHDPAHDDNTIERLFEDAVRLFKPSFEVCGGREGAVFEVRARGG